jgi:hypothetical protein
MGGSADDVVEFNESNRRLRVLDGPDAASAAIFYGGFRGS